MSTPAVSSQVVHLRAAGVSVVVDVAGPALPRVLHWGADLGALTDDELAVLAVASVAAIPRSSFDHVVTIPLVPTERDGWSGTPGLSGHRGGAEHVPLLHLIQPPLVTTEAAGGGRIDAVAGGDGLRLQVVLVLDEHGTVTVSTVLTNVGTGVYDLAGVLPLMPLPAHAAEIVDLTGRWCAERQPQRAPLLDGTHLRAGRRGRPGHDSPLLLMCGSTGFGFRSGDVWAVHSAWSGNAQYLAERLPDGAGAATSVLAAGELLAPGEIRLAPEQTYTSPDAVFVYSATGMDGISERVHARLRARPTHPSTPRPVVLNTWEAVYFDHDADRLRALAEVAASVGVERFVLDDGWFGGRRHARAGLGDWYVSGQVWPEGLAPLFDHVRGLGMQVGLWVEPEMANPDSDLVRAHPDWLLTADAALWRHQQVLDLARPEAFDHLLDRLDAIVTQYRIDFLKWDHNRDLHVAVHSDPDGAQRPGVHGQTAALYRLLDELRSRHPRLEIESCASGGARVDLGIAGRTDRFWTSDTNDALDRQAIQRWTGLLLPYELMGAHVGPPRTHTTHRVLDLGFRCATALFGHAGLEWDLTGCSEQELATIRSWVALYKRTRGLLHSGKVVRADLAGDSALLHGVVAQDGSTALFSYVQLTGAAGARPAPVCLPGLDPLRNYSVRLCEGVSPPSVVQSAPPRWLQGDLVVPGSVLLVLGLPMPVLAPASAVLLELAEVTHRR